MIKLAASQATDSAAPSNTSTRAKRPPATKRGQKKKNENQPYTEEHASVPVQDQRDVLNQIGPDGL